MTPSAGQLHSTIRLFELVSRNRLSSAELRASMKTLLVSPTVDVINISTRCGWIEIDLDGCLFLTKRGSLILSLSDYRLSDK